MEQDKMVICDIKRMIRSLPADQREACTELVYHLKRACRLSGQTVGSLALALVGAEAQDGWENIENSL